MVDLMHWAQLRWVQLRWLTNLLFFDIPLLYCYTNLNSSTICCLSSGDMYLLFGASISLFCNSLGNFFETLVILSAILLPIKLPVASAVFWIALFEAVFIASVDHIYCFNFYPCFKQKAKIHIILHIFFYISRFNWIIHFYTSIDFSFSYYN